MFKPCEKNKTPGGVLQKIREASLGMNGLADVHRIISQKQGSSLDSVHSFWCFSEHYLPRKCLKTSTSAVDFWREHEAYTAVASSAS